MLSDSSIDNVALKNQEPDDNDRPIIPDDQENSASATVPSRFGYDVFAGWAGERRLEGILQKILPDALYKVWDALKRHQVQGNEAYLSMESLAATFGRQERTVRVHIKELKDRKLLVMRPIRKMLPQPDGSVRMRVVVEKDFSGLYQLAYEYYRWTQSDWYIAPDRDLADAIKADTRLAKYLLRYNNYRRILRNELPGPKPTPKEAHSWYTDMTLSDPLSEECQDLREETSSMADQNANDANEEQKCALRKEYQQSDLQNNQQVISNKRKKTNLKKENQRGDSFDSEGARRKGVAGGYTKNQAAETDNDLLSPPTKTKSAFLPGLEKDRAGGQKEQEERNRDFVVNAHAAARKRRAAKQIQDVPPPSNSLVSAFASMASLLFNDDRPESSKTGLLRAAARHPLSQVDILACLVKAYQIALQTAVVRAEYRHPNGDNKMPLFTSMARKFLDGLVTGTFRYSQEQLENDIQGDERLVEFVLKEHRAAVEGEGDQALPFSLNEEPQLFPDGELGPMDSGMQEHNVVCSDDSREARPTRSPEEKQGREEYARRVQSKLRYAGVPGSVELIVDNEHLHCGSPLYRVVSSPAAGTERWKCAHCVPDSRWSQDVVELVATILDH